MLYPVTQNYCTNSMLKCKKFINFSEEVSNRDPFTLKSTALFTMKLVYLFFKYIGTVRNRFLSVTYRMCTCIVYKLAMK
jgi:hypothetical protein